MGYLIQEAIKEASRRAFKELFDRAKIIPGPLLQMTPASIGSAGLCLPHCAWMKKAV